MKYADVALNLPALNSFQYEIPEPLAGRVQPGSRVWVSVRNRRLVGTVVGLSHESAVPNVKPIESLLEGQVLDAHFLELTRWMAETTFSSWGQCIDAVLPAPFRRGRFSMKSRAAKPTDAAEPERETDYALTPGQAAAYRAVREAMRSEKKAVFLLRGVTGSGKTEIYIHLIRECLKQGKGSIVLVPEISLTPQTVDRFYSRFGDNLAVLHSRLAEGRRSEEWHKIRNGRARVVVGARSAIFAPLDRIGLIVIDEEHETSYKQEEAPRYETRRVAEKRAELAGAALILGSATPSLESYARAESGEIRKLVLSERVERRPLPIVDIVDMRREIAGKTPRLFSVRLEEALRETLGRGEQAMLFLNRRGFSTYLHCPACGYVLSCKNCRISLAYHYDKASLFCHLCRFRTFPVRLCPACQKHYLHYFGAGTQKVESEAERLFPGARIGRMDSDSTARQNTHETILRAFRRREIDLLIGTQMIAKGHDFPYVSLIGVISADTALHVPDFRSAERTFSLLAQVAGRAGRGDIPGRVLVQTTVPHHYSIQSAKDHDYEKFYRMEIEFRRELHLPPFSRLVRVVVSGTPEKLVLRKILELTQLLKKDLSVLGPSPCLPSRQKSRFLWNLYVKTERMEQLLPRLRETFEHFNKSGIRFTVDVDPL